MARRQFSREFKLEAVRLVKERGVDLPPFSWTVYATSAACRSAWSGVR